MSQLKSLAIGLLAIGSIAPASNAFTLDNLPASNLPAAHLSAQVRVDILIGIGAEPRPQPQTRERVIVVERNTQTIYDNDRYRSSESRGHKKGWYKHGGKKSHHDRNRNHDDD